MLFNLVLGFLASPPTGAPGTSLRLENFTSSPETLPKVHIRMVNVPLQDGDYYIKTFNKMYLRACGSEEGSRIDFHERPEIWERFSVRAIGPDENEMRYTIRNVHHGCFLRATPERELTGQVAAKEWEHFHIIRSSDGHVGIRSCAHNTYICATVKEKAWMQPHFQEHERLEMVPC